MSPAEARALAGEEVQRTTNCRLQAAEETLLVQDSTVARLEAKLDQSQRGSGPNEPRHSLRQMGEELAVEDLQSDQLQHGRDAGGQHTLLSSARPEAPLPPGRSVMASMESGLDWSRLEAEAIDAVADNSYHDISCDLLKDGHGGELDLSQDRTEESQFGDKDVAGQRLAQLQKKLAALGVRSVSAADHAIE